MTRQEFGHRLGLARRHAGLTQHQAAARLGVPQPRVAEYEAGRRLPSILKLLEIITTLKLDVTILFPEFYEHH
jgi:transcriptional regulator with XRE-family HTH domain